MLIIISLSLAACSENKNAASSQYELGIKYLNDKKYEEAILVFEEAIEIDPQNPQNYIALSDAYALQNLFDKAEEILEKGYKNTKSIDINELLLGVYGQEKKDTYSRIETVVDVNGIRTETAYNANDEVLWYRVHNVQWNREKYCQEGTVQAFDVEDRLMSECSMYREGEKIYTCGFNEDTGDVLKLVLYRNNIDKSIITKQEYYYVEGNMISYLIREEIDKKNYKMIEYTSEGDLKGYVQFNNDGNSEIQTHYNNQKELTYKIVTLIGEDSIIYTYYDEANILLKKEVRINNDDGSSMVKCFEITSLTQQ